MHLVMIVAISIDGEDLWWIALKAANGKADGEKGEEGDGDQMLKEMFDKSWETGAFCCLDD